MSLLKDLLVDRVDCSTYSHNQQLHNLSVHSDCNYNEDDCSLQQILVAGAGLHFDYLANTDRTFQLCIADLLR